MTRFPGKTPKELYMSKERKRLKKMSKKDLIQMMCDIRFIEEMMGYGYTVDQIIAMGDSLDPIRVARIKKLTGYMETEHGTGR
jgi:hypothetical protein